MLDLVSILSAFKIRLLYSYLPILQYDATLFGTNNNRKSIEEVISFNLRPNLSFRIMGVFYPSEIGVIVPTIKPMSRTGDSNHSLRQISFLKFIGHGGIVLMVSFLYNTEV